MCELLQCINQFSTSRKVLNLHILISYEKLREINAIFLGAFEKFILPV